MHCMLSDAAFAGKSVVVGTLNVACDGASVDCECVVYCKQLAEALSRGLVEVFRSDVCDADQCNVV